ncbi:MAG TPA: Nramp family divalent metal transporter [Candidatus Sulfotelmatobacter sp.]|nr:Nramp family divalent metal transporter [Candidatus Sulfotelmatobacter sp.]
MDTHAELAFPSPPPRPGDRRTLEVASQVLRGDEGQSWYGRLWPFLGPAFIACVAYIDPGNYATNIQGGAQFGYMLLWVIVASNLMAMLVQTLSAKLGIATGRNLAELCREDYPRWASVTMWVLMEIVAMATDLAEFLGAAVGFNLLLGIPLLPAGLLTGVTTFLILALERRGFRPLEAVISAMVGIIALCYLAETILDRPAWRLLAYHAVVPAFRGSESVLLATGILGATVMPHVIFLHSALTQGRILTRKPDEARRLFRFECVDVALAMGIAGLVNMAMLIMAAATFHQHGLASVGTIEEAYKTLTPLLGGAASAIFALSLLASGLSSSTVGTMSGQVVMQGFIHWQIPVWLRRLLTMVPALVVIAAGLDPTRTLVLSQVVLSFGLPFALVPLVRFTARTDLMGILVNRRWTTLLAWVVTSLIVALNIFLLYQTLWGG